MYISGAVLAFIIGLIGGFKSYYQQKKIHPAARDDFSTIIIRTIFSSMIYGILSWLGVFWAISVLIQSND